MNVERSAEVRYFTLGTHVLSFCLGWGVVLGQAAIAQSSPPFALPDSTPRLIAQTPPSPPATQPVVPNLPRFQPAEPPSQVPLPRPIPPTPSLELPAEPNPQPDTLIPGSIPGKIVVQRFDVVGSTVFSPAELAQITAPFTNRPITFAELMQVQEAITKRYVDQGYITSGAVIPPQTLEQNVVVVQIVEGELEDILVTGTRRLNPNYVRSRLAIGARKPLNREKLLQALQLLQFNPLIQSISAELSSGPRPGTNFLEVRVNEAKTFNAQIDLDNNRSPAVGSLRRGARITEANLLGQGDVLQVGYANTTGSNVIDFNYAYPVNPRNGTVSVNFEQSWNRIVEEPFDPLDIKANSFNLSLNFRQPIIETPNRLVALGVSAYRRESQTSILGVPLKLSAGANDEGLTRVSALRFFQEWVERGSQFVLAARSELSVGVDAFDAWLDTPPPNGRFFYWRGQLQWVRQFAADTFFILRSDMQLADRPLSPFDQFSVGGWNTVRGYRQDLLLADNGITASAEFRYPILRLNQGRGVLQVTPFVDVGNVWNSNQSLNPDPNFLASVGLGLRWQQGNLLTFHLVWGIPLVSVDSSKDTWQEKGLTFSLVYNLF